MVGFESFQRDTPNESFGPFGIFLTFNLFDHVRVLDG
jgi:hypothetical protein